MGPTRLESMICLLAPLLTGSEHMAARSTAGAISDQVYISAHPCWSLLS